MLKKHLLTSAIGLFCLTVQAAPPPSNGIELPETYKNWRVIGVSHRDDNDSLRAITGNAIAMQAVRAGKTDPWPDGTVLGKLVWKDSRHPLWQPALVPGELSHIEFMIKDRKKYKATGGWGFARWVGMKLEPLNNQGGKSCFECHQTAAKTDYVFTRPAPLP
ncbi:cytochrome P460 family protein [Methylohalobius crimeensis]|uniref:cytochrome P460 family protein n=1 Tax=Methylohalobius crimeensis TaxID=244365 RepID=UPI0003B735B0|nr:cytochrome P460 family protein [Methylohalobius crimeensis]